MQSSIEAALLAAVKRTGMDQSLLIVLRTTTTTRQAFTLFAAQQCLVHDLHPGHARFHLHTLRHKRLNGFLADFDLQ